jgi:hypothetical protein
LFGVTFSPEARGLLELALLHTEGCEVLFRGKYDFATKVITHVEVMARGNEKMVAGLHGQFPVGAFHLHSHPGDHATPSEADIKCAEELAVVGVGLAIVNRDASRFHVVTLPRQAPPIATRTRAFRVGRTIYTFSRYRR